MPQPFLRLGCGSLCAESLEVRNREELTHSPGSGRQPGALLAQVQLQSLGTRPPVIMRPPSSLQQPGEGPGVGWEEGWKAAGVRLAMSPLREERRELWSDLV